MFQRGRSTTNQIKNKKRRITIIIVITTNITIIIMFIIIMNLNIHSTAYISVVFSENWPLFCPKILIGESVDPHRMPHFPWMDWSNSNFFIVKSSGWWFGTSFFPFSWEFHHPN